jgi:hypothetical protein
MHRLRKLWQDAAFWNGLPGDRLGEYILIGAYSSVAVLSLVINLTAKAGTLFGRAVENGSYSARPELKAMMKQFMTASADLSAGASLLILALGIVYWSRRAKRAQGVPLEPTVASGPPFLL